MAKYDTFTVSFFPESYHKALGYLGSHSGRDENKVANSGLTPVVAGDGVTFKEAELTFVCKKLYEHQFDEAYLAEKVKDYYASNPAVYTPVSYTHLLNVRGMLQKYILMLCLENHFLANRIMLLMQH